MGGIGSRVLFLDSGASDSRPRNPLAKIEVTSSRLRSITQVMDPRRTAPRAAQQPGGGPPATSDGEPGGETTLPGVPATSTARSGRTGLEVTGREFFALPEFSRSDGGLVFDAIELAPVAQIDSEGTCEAFESLDDVPDELRSSVFWSIYGHTPGEGVQCIGDFKTPAHALEVLRRLFGDMKPLR